MTTYDPTTYKTEVSGQGLTPARFYAVNKLLMDMDAAGIIDLVVQADTPSVGDQGNIWLDISSPESGNGVPKLYSGSAWTTLTPALFFAYVAGQSTADVTTDGVQTLTNKTIALSSNTISGTTAQFNTALSDGDFATLAGSETLTNKTLTSPTLTTPALGTPASGNLNNCVSDQIKLNDSDDSHQATFAVTSNLSAARAVSITMPDADTPLNLITPPRGVPGYVTGRFYAGDLANLGNPSTLAISANVLYAVPFAVGTRATWTRIGIDVTSTAVGNARLGIYAADGAGGMPGTLVLDAGTVSVDTSTGTKEVTISQALNPGFYWLAIVSNATPTIRATASTNASFSCAMGLAAIGTADTQYSIAHTYGALPTPFGSGSYAAANTPIMTLRVV